MNAQDLKNSILQLAVQGKLVEQRAEEGTARELLEQIKLEKEQLIKDKKIKKSKPLPEITEDEIPFEIPESWEWVRLNVLFEVLNGDRGKNYPAKSTLHHEGIPFISAVNLDGKSVLKDDNLLCLSKEQYDKLGNGKLIKGDVVVCIRGSLGKHGKYPFDVGAIASSLVICRQHGDDEILSEYFMRYLDAPLFFSQIRLYDNGTAQPNLAAKSLEQFLIPLPPLEEQHRIVTKIEKILPYIDQYDKAYTKLETFNKKFPEDMKKSILQMAMHGKLVEQRPEEGTADELYEQIQDAKKKFGIKKNKKILNISEEDYLYDIPKTWKWVRIGEIFQTSSGTTPLKSNQDYYNSQDYSWVRTTDLNNGILTHGEVKISQKAKDECNLDIIPYNSVCLAMYGGAGTIGKNALIQFETTINQSVCAIHPNGFFNMKYLLYYTQFFRPLWMNYASGSRKDPNINQVIINNAVIPLPPLEEQHRIVAKIEELLPYCNQLIK